MSLSKLNYLSHIVYKRPFDMLPQATADELINLVVEAHDEIVAFMQAVSKTRKE